MHIPTIYVLFSAEIVLVLLGITIFLLFYIKKQASIPTLDKADADSVDISNSYIDYLELEIEKNNSQSMNVETDEMEEQDVSDDALNDSEPESETETLEKEAGLNEEQTSASLQKSKLLEARNLFLSTEKTAAENAEDENAFWDAIYSGMQTIVEQYGSVQEVPVPATEEKLEEIEDTKPEKKDEKEKVLYIETQGKKIDNEVNKLKDIIYDQENTLSSLQKALKEAEENQPEGADFESSEEFQNLKQQAGEFERQINDSKMCMEVLEMENDRLQEEVNNLEGRYDELFKKQAEVEAELAKQKESGEGEENENLNQMKEVLDKQEQQIVELNSTIDKLQLSAQEAETLKQQLSEFTRNSQEMMGCIAILEDENENLNNLISELESQLENMPTEKVVVEDGEASDNLLKMQEELNKQEARISELNETIDELQLTAEQAEKLKATIADFSRSSQEMMGCITILEEENDNLQNMIGELEAKLEAAPEASADVTEGLQEIDMSASANEEEVEKLKTKVKKYEKEIIKKDVAYAKLQDEFSTLEKEMKALYEKHGE